METTLWEFQDGTKVTLVTDNEEIMDEMNRLVKDLADNLDMSVEMEVI